MHQINVLPSLHCFSGESPLAASASAGGFAQVSQLPEPPWYAPESVSLWVCGHVYECAKWVFVPSRPAWQPCFTRAFTRGCVCVCHKKEKVCVMCRTPDSGPIESPPLLQFLFVLKHWPFSCVTALLQSAVYEVNECVWECVQGREREHALFPFSSLFSCSDSFPSLPLRLTSFRWGLNQVTGLMWRYSSY